MVNNFQREGSESNSHVGRKFEAAAQKYWSQEGISLENDYSVQIGFSRKKGHKFDLGSDEPPVLVECKDHKWTESGNVPSGKFHAWNEAMYYFHLAPEKFRKILFVRRDFSAKQKESLAEYYVRTRGHLIPEDVEIWEYDERKSTAVLCYPKTSM